MRGEAMKRVVAELERRGFDLGTRRALEFFAREGDWQTVAYSGKAKSLDAWEIDPAFEANLRRNLPRATVRITDSFAEAEKPEYRRRFEFIVCDNPQGSYGPGNRYTEHFQALERILPMLAPGGVVIFNVNRAPFDFDRNPDWRKKRSDFYGIPDTSRLDVDFLFGFYEAHFRKLGYRTLFRFDEARNAEYLSYLVFSLEPSADGA